jgi:hypothetical protein
VEQDIFFDKIGGIVYFVVVEKVGTDPLKKMAKDGKEIIVR